MQNPGFRAMHGRLAPVTGRRQHAPSRKRLFCELDFPQGGQREWYRGSEQPVVSYCRDDRLFFICCGNAGQGLGSHKHNMRNGSSRNEEAYREPRVGGTRRPNRFELAREWRNGTAGRRATGTSTFGRLAPDTGPRLLMSRAERIRPDAGSTRVVPRQLTGLSSLIKETTGFFLHIQTLI